MLFALWFEAAESQTGRMSLNPSGCYCGQFMDMPFKSVAAVACRSVWQNCCYRPIRTSSMGHSVAHMGAMASSAGDFCAPPPPARPALPSARQGLPITGRERRPGALHPHACKQSKYTLLFICEWSEACVANNSPMRPSDGARTARYF